MSLFQNVLLKLPCEKCGSIRETNIRFHSAVKYDADFILGERVPEEEPLNIGEEYEGNADLYCWDCLRQWTYDQLQAEYEVFSELVEQGRLMMMPEDSELNLSPDKIQEQGVARFRATRIQASQRRLLIVIMNSLSLGKVSQHRGAVMSGETCSIQSSLW